MVRKNMKGGHSPSPWTPEEYKGVGTIAVGGDPNYAKPPDMYSSNQVGGKKRSRSQRGGMSYGFANTADVPTVAGSYTPVTPMCTAKVDASRGGNNFMSGGKGRSKTQKGGLILLGGGKSKKRSRTQRGGLILLGGKRSKSKRSKSKKRSKKTLKWLQKGCSKKK